VDQAKFNYSAEEYQVKEKKVKVASGASFLAAKNCICCFLHGKLPMYVPMYVSICDNENKP
jgi:hypothetical protein